MALPPVNGCRASEDCFALFPLLVLPTLSAGLAVSQVYEDRLAN
jgi:hypothetical protein